MHPVILRPFETDNRSAWKTENIDNKQEINIFQLFRDIPNNLLSNE